MLILKFDDSKLSIYPANARALSGAIPAREQKQI